MTARFWMQPKTSSITKNICISSFVIWKQFLSHLITIKLHLLFEMMEGAYLTAIHGCCLLVLIEWNQATLQNVIPCIRHGRYIMNIRSTWRI